MPHPEMALLFFLIACIYASVGFGGGSSYLAVLALYALPFKEMRIIALVCNIIVVTGGTLIFIRHKQVDFKKISPLVIASVPMAFVGAALKISQDVFFVLLGVALVAAAVLLWIETSRKIRKEEVFKESSVIKNALLGGGIGFLSGMVGIGGGIFLAPLLNLMQWDTPRKIAATASVFILLNSISGIVGQLYQMPAGLPYVEVLVLALSVFLGGQLGARLGALKFNLRLIRRITAVVVFVAGIEVLHKHLFSFK